MNDMIREYEQLVHLNGVEINRFRSYLYDTGRISEGTIEAEVFDIIAEDITTIEGGIDSALEFYMQKGSQAVYPDGFSHDQERGDFFTRWEDEILEMAENMGNVRPPLHIEFSASDRRSWYATFAFDNIASRIKDLWDEFSEE